MFEIYEEFENSLKIFLYLQLILRSYWKKYNKLLPS